MKSILFVILSFLVIIFISGFIPAVENDELSKCLNLNFEYGTNGKPNNWYTQGSFDFEKKRINSAEEEGFAVKLDSVTKHSGYYGLRIDILPYGNRGSARAACYKYLDSSLLKTFRGKLITYSGWIKIKDVTSWVGLWWRVDGKKGTLAFNNMYDSSISGTHEWHKYSFSLPFSDSATGFDFGVLIHSKNGGTAWFDDLSIDTNGVPYLH